MEVNTSDESGSSDDEDEEEYDEHAFIDYQGLHSNNNGNIYINNNNNNNNGTQHHHVNIDNIDEQSSHGYRFQQLLHLEEEDVEVNLYGYRYNGLRYLIYRTLCVLTLGIVWLIGRWVPEWWIRWIGEPVPLKDANWLVFKVKYI